MTDEPAIESDPTPFAMIPRWVLEHPSLDPVAKVVWIVLHDHVMGKQGSSWPSMSTIARRVGASETTVRERLKDLRNVGAIRVEERLRPDGSRTSNRYVLTWENPRKPNETAPTGAEGGPSGSRTPVIRTIEEERTNQLTSFDESEPTRPSNPPTPQGGPSSSSPPKRRKKQNAATILKPLDAEVFEAWWSFYPVKKRKADAMASWANALEAGVSTDVLETALQHYLASIDDWEARAGQKLKFLLAAPRFIDGEYMDFVDGPDPDRWKQPEQAETDRPVEWTAWEQPTWSGEPDYDDE